MASGAASPLYNPSLLSDADFIRSFVARQDYFQRLEQRLAEIPAEGLCHHFLILGQRGMGKTSLMRRLALATTHNPVLSAKLIPLVFREEQYNVHTLASFWRNCVEALADWFDSRAKSDLALKLDHELASSRFSLAGSDHEGVLTLFKRFCRLTGRRPVLFIDNIDIILRAIGPDEWSLRRELQEPCGPIMVGTSAALMEAVLDPEAAFYDFFQIETLDRLHEREVLACLKQIARNRGELGASVIEILDKDPGRVQAVAGLAGGNPRTLAILYRILEADISHDVFEDIEYLLDEVTALYKARTEDLAPQARVVLDATALAWNPVSASQISQETTLLTSAVSTQLDRLEKVGIIEKVALPGTARQGYQIAERFFNIWYLMRHGPRRRRTQLRWLTEFLRNFYSRRELMSRVGRMLETAVDSRYGTFDLYVALADAIGSDAWSKLICTELRRAPPGLESVASALNELPEPITAWDWIEQAELLFYDLNDCSRAQAAAHRALEVAPASARALTIIGMCYSQLKNYEEAEKVFQEARNSEPLDWRPYARAAWYLHRPCKRWPDAISMLQQALLRNPCNANLWFQLGYAHSEIRDYRSAELAYRRSVELQPVGAGHWSNLGFIISREPSRTAEAMEAWERAVENEPDNLNSWVLMFDSARLTLQDNPAALNIAKRAVAANPKSAIAWRLLARALSENVGGLQEAIEAGRHAVELGPQEGANWFELGLALRAGSDKLKEAEDAFEKAIANGFLPGWIQLFDIAASQENEARLRYLAQKMQIAQPRPLELQYAAGRITSSVSMAIAKLIFENAIRGEPESVSDWHCKGYYLSYYLDRLDEGLAAFQRAYDLDPADFVAETNLLVMKMVRPGQNDVSTSELERNILKHPEAAQALIRALRCIHVDDVACAAFEFESSLKTATGSFYDEYEGFFNLFLKTSFRRGHGPKLLAIFAETTFQDQFWPVAAAFEALVRGPHTLLSVNLEVREVASQIYRRLSFERAEEDHIGKLHIPRQSRAKPKRRLR